MASSPASAEGPSGPSERGTEGPSGPSERGAERPSRPIVLVGMMGAGKTTVGRALAANRGWEFCDSDRQVEARAGRSVADIWRDEGEVAFRALESEVLAEGLSSSRPAVVAAAGGVVLDPANRALLRSRARVVWLRARPETLARRVGAGADRPLLASDPPAVLARLSEERRPLYDEVAEVVVDVDGLTPGEVVERIEAALVTDDPLIRIPVRVPEESYEALVGKGARHRLPEVLPPGAARAAIVTQAGIGVDVDAGIEQRTFLLGRGEESKVLASVEALCRGFAQWGLTRGDVVVAVGGGVVTDAAGLAAALYHRGVAVVNVPTTLLGQVDAAIGGKTGVNLPEGKNLVGAFWQPAAVLCDTEVLATLPEREYRSGLGEMAKYAFLGVDNLRRLPLDEAVAACVRCKAEAVAADQHDRSGRRALLNYGHTLAHALETAGRYDLRHGEAVAIGLVYAAELAMVLGRVDSARVEMHRELVHGYGLPEKVPAGYADAGQLLDLLARDKKAIEGLTFVLDGPSGLEVVKGVSRRDAERALVRVL